MRIQSLLALGVILCTGGLVACHREQARERPLTPVTVRTVGQYSGGGGARYSGNIEPFSQVDLAFKVGGYIQEILQVRGVDGRMRNVQGGDRVVKGTVLARVRESDYLDKVNQAKAQLAQAKVATEQAKLDFDRASNLFATQSLTKPEFDAAKARLDATQAVLEGATAQLSEAELAREDCALKAPMDGVLLKRMIEVGALVGPGTPGFVLADTDSVRVVFGVADVLLETLKVGSFIDISTQAFGARQFRGQVTTISPSADPRSRVFDVELKVPNPKQELRPGMIAALQLPGEKLTAPVPVVPLSAIVRPKDDLTGYAVLVVEEESGKQVAHARKVRLGEVYGNTIAVTEGLRSGERVIVAGATLVTDAEAVRIIP